MCSGRVISRLALPSFRWIFTRGLAAAVLIGSAVTPVSAQMLVGDGSVTCGTTHVVASGDTLSKVSQQAYGDPLLYGFIADANWDALGGNPENVTIGMELAIPCVDASGQILTAEQAAEAAASMQAVVEAQGVLSPEQLDTLFGPVALFPDLVLTPVLVAVTFPLDVVKAARFVEDSASLADQDRAAQAADQPWDDSVRELAAGFPDLVTRMSDNIDWTEQAGEAVVAQTDAVLEAVQRLRSKAQDNGYLVDNEAQKIEETNDTIVIAPATPNVVYVPTYDSQVVYTTPIVGAPVYHYGYDSYNDGRDNWDDALIAGGIILGGAIILDKIFDNDDWDGWDRDDNIDWDRGDITIDRGEINIDRGDRGDIVIGDGDRISIGDSERRQIDRDDLASLSDRAGTGDRARAATLSANRTPISNATSRDVARQKIEARQSAGAAQARLQPSRSLADRSPGAGVGQANRQPSRLEATRPSASTTRAVSQNLPSTRTAVSRPTAQRTPEVRSAPSRSSAFSKPSGTHRAAASSNRGRSSMGSRGGGRGGGGRGR